MLMMRHSRVPLLCEEKIETMCEEKREKIDEGEKRKGKLTPLAPTPLAVQHLDWRRPRAYPHTPTILAPLPHGTKGRKSAGNQQESAGRPQRAGAARRGGRGRQRPAGLRGRVSGAARKSGGGPVDCQGGAICTLETRLFCTRKRFFVFTENITVSTFGICPTKPPVSNMLRTQFGGMPPWRGK